MLAPAAAPEVCFSEKGGSSPPCSTHHMQNLHRETVVRASMRQMSAELSGEAVVLNFDDGVYYSLNRVGARIWMLIQDPRKVADLLATLTDEYDVEPARCEADLLTLLTELRGLNLVEVQDVRHP